MTLKIVLCGTLEDVKKRMLLDYERISKAYPKANVVRRGNTIKINSTWINKYISVGQLKNIDRLKPRYMEADVSAFLVATSKQMKLATEWYQSVSVINYGKDD
ncbi:hypothetical protein [Lactiplantibacillus plantarum]|uniref:hypothetical protein n=1 Tax=Lactiplantibacillus plantarum TaxID=1590 RepID=UPI000BAEBF67|nr:hypothetical protein [Lactiplantibacillus plantarum]ASZ32897.1 hypothetical protein CLC99_06245 [Lactiplantibacillus plantarum]MCB4211184.1 hypothetical protein [Lactiplantibacillus plantarum]WGJ12457.1 hypothetical protein QEO67_06385 [Lactiplantibacillus plantarum]GFF01554.1 hypothetical protein DmLsi_33570 [Lactiplantibacillus plantarum]